MEATTEAREAVQGLRFSAAATADPVSSIGALIEQLRSEAAGEAPQIRVASHGTARALRPVVADEVYFIAAEALRNAVRHAGAQQITAEIRYENRRFRARIHDDGRGFDAQALRREPPAGHLGLPGMRERAEIVGGSVDVWSKPGFGTLVELSIPAAIAYAAAPRPRSGVFARLARPLSWHGRAGPASDR
jgi:signal transduction histidine kinase